MAKLKLNANPTFTAKVEIPMAGAAPAEVEFTFKHRKRDEIPPFIEACAGRSDVDNILEMASGWDLADTFARESVELMAQDYVAAPEAIFEKYLEELTKGRRKN